MKLRSLSSRAGRVVGIDFTLALDGAAAGVQLVRALLGQEAAALEVLEGLVRVRVRVGVRVRARVSVRCCDGGVATRVMVRVRLGLGIGGPRRPA